MRTRNRSSLCLSLSLLVLAGTGVGSTAHAQTAPRPAPLDPAPPIEEQVLQIFSLENVKADKDLLKTLQVLLSRASTLATDERTNSLIIQADRKQLEIARELLQALDVPAAAAQADPAQQDRTVRIVWLMTDLEEGGAIPDDMSQIVNELSRYGVTGLQLATQTIVRGRQRFTTSAHPDLDGRPVSLQISGTFITEGSSGERANMEISVGASTSSVTTDAIQRTGRGPTTASSRISKESLAELQTTVLAPFGHPVVLCMTPIKQRTSVFIVQVLPAR